MKVLYYDCFSGISGDMNLGAMIDLGVDPDYLLSELKKLNIGEYQVEITQDKRKGITGTRVEVVVNPVLSGQVMQERTFTDISRIIGKSDLSTKVKDISLNIFTRIAVAEGKIHGCKADDVHFHEVGAVDSIVDIAGAAICLDYLSPDTIISSPVQLGGGFVRCAHGILPVPAPATVEILQGIPVKTGAVPFETTTPTGAAILAATVDVFTEELDFTPQKIGYGIGHRDTDIPNVLRAYLGVSLPTDSEDTDDTENKTALLVECNIDDMNPELYEDVMEELFAQGAYDVFLTPIIMKKSRPAITLSVLCGEEERLAIEEILWLRTSTFGLRFQRISKSMLQRDFVTLSTKFGDVSVKNGYWRGRKIKSKAEYEDCKRLAKEKGVSVKEIYDSLPSASKDQPVRAAGTDKKTVRKK
ncbi:MAG: nickel pincer cofactor biosynthesis protein LarC [Smithellaceae bacterium]